MVKTFLTSLGIGCVLAVLMWVVMTFILPPLLAAPGLDEAFVLGVRKFTLAAFGIFVALIAGGVTFGLGHDYDKTPTKELLRTTAIVATGVGIPFVVAFFLS